MHVHTRYTCILVSLYMVDNLLYTLKSCTVLAFENSESSNIIDLF